MRKITIAIIGVGHEGASLYNCLKQKENITIVAIADLIGEGIDFDEADMNFALVSNSLEEIMSLDNLDIIIETTNDPEISKRIHSLKKPGVQVIESSVLEVIITLKNKRNSLEANFLSLLTNVEDGIQIVNEDGIITYINDAFLRITGFSEDELIGCNIFERFKDSPMTQAIKRRKPHSGQQCIFDGLKGEYRFTITPIIIGDKFTGAIGVFKESPEITRLMKELQRSSTIIEEIYDKISYINGIPDIGDSDIVPIDRMEQALLRQALTKYGYSVEGKKRAAKALNISLATLYNKLKKYQIS